NLCLFYFSMPLFGSLHTALPCVDLHDAFSYSNGCHLDLHSFPTRRSSDLIALLPIPVIITRPFISSMACTVLIKSSLIFFVSLLIASASNVSAEMAIFSMLDLVFTDIFY